MAMRRLNAAKITLAAKSAVAERLLLVEGMMVASAPSARSTSPCSELRGVAASFTSSSCFKAGTASVNR